MIVASNLSRSFGKTKALDGVSLEIGRGELFALIGPDGAGKSTFFRIVAGLLEPSGGSARRDAATVFGMVPQRFSLYEDLTVDENITLRADLYGVPSDEARRRSEDLLARVGMNRFGARLAGALSGGMKQKLALVVALLTRPSLLLLDEPTTGVDPVSRREFWKLLNRLHHEGLTIVVSTPYMDEAEYATRLGFLDRGRLVAVGTRQQILRGYVRPLLRVVTDERMEARRRLTALPAVDDVSLFGAVLHVRGRSGTSPDLLREARTALSGLVPADGVEALEPSLEDVFVLLSEEAAA